MPTNPLKTYARAAPSRLAGRKRYWKRIVTEILKL